MAEGQTISEPNVAAAADQAAPPAVATKSSLARSIFETIGWTALFAALIFGWVWWQTGSASLVWPYLQGQRLLFDPAHIVIEDAARGAIIERTVRVLNLTSSEVRLVGSQQSCGCIALDEFLIFHCDSIPRSRRQLLEKCNSTLQLKLRSCSLRRRSCRCA